MSVYGIAGKIGKAYMRRMNFGQMRGFIANNRIRFGLKKMMLSSAMDKGVITPGQAFRSAAGSIARATGRTAKGWAWDQAGGNLNRTLRIGTLAAPGLLAGKVYNDLRKADPLFGPKRGE